MSLATRCTACGTVFRVVQDQLRVSGGWVRCGRCGEVFNAVESLIDLEIERPAESAAAGAHGARVMLDLADVAGPSAGEPAPARAPAAPASSAPPGGRAAAVPDLDDEADDRAAPPAPARAGLATEAATDATAQAGVPGAAEVPVDGVVLAAGAAPGPAAGPPAGAPAADEPTPSFLRQAERAARWRRPRVRAGLALLALLAAAALLWQLTLVQHDLMAARWPALRPAIERLCELGGCSVEPPRRIEGLTVESSGLVRAGPPGAYRLSLVLRNREGIAVRMPFVDLALTDAAGSLLARRVLEPAQLGAPQPSIGAGRELPLAATLRVRDAAVAGYTIEIFYP